MASNDSALVPLGASDQVASTSMGEPSTTDAQDNDAAASRSTRSSSHRLKSVAAFLGQNFRMQMSSKSKSPSKALSTIGTSVLFKTNHRSLNPRDIEAASEVFNIPELLELILTNLSIRDLFSRAPLVCRGFKAAIEASPTIRRDILAASHLDLDSRSLCRSLHHCLGPDVLLPSALRFMPSNRFTWLFDFRKGPSFEDHRASPSFRSLRLLHGQIGFLQQRGPKKSRNFFSHKCSRRRHIRPCRFAGFTAGTTFGKVFDQLTSDDHDCGAKITMVEVWVLSLYY